jgi:thioredoxin reductase (NADPH)
VFITLLLQWKPAPHWFAGGSRWRQLETSEPGIFAAGDVRVSSIKRVASAVGAGVMAVQFAHDYLASN